MDRGKKKKKRNKKMGSELADAFKVVDQLIFPADPL